MKPSHDDTECDTSQSEPRTVFGLLRDAVIRIVNTIGTMAGVGVLAAAAVFKHPKAQQHED